MRSSSTGAPPPRLTGVLMAFGCFAWLVAAGGQEPPPRAPNASEFFFHHDHVIGTSLDLHVVAPSRDAAEACEAAVLAEIERLRRVFSTYDAASELSRLNGAGGAFRASAEMIEVLRLYEHHQRRSHGAFNGQLGGLVRAWKEAERTGAEPDAAALARIVAEANRPGWEIDEARQTVTRLTGQPLDLNSIAKGYILQKAAAAGRSRAPLVQGLLLNLGGDLAVWGRDEAGRGGWAVGVQDPLRPEDNAPPLAVLGIGERAVATSGGYARGYTVGGKRYSHLFDPRTGRPAAGVAGATVVARDNVTANALATTLCVLAPAEGLALVAATPGAECLVVGADGRQFRSAGFAALELPRAAPAPAPQAGGDRGKADSWPGGYQVTVDLTLPRPGGGKRVRRPYVAVWLEDAAGKPVRTLTVWGNQPRWQPTLTTWWKLARDDRKLVKAVTRATRAPGQYQLVWDGKDDRGAAVPQGSYTVRVEVHREHGKHVHQAGRIDCRAEPARVTLEANAETGATQVAYGPRKQP